MTRSPTSALVALFLLLAGAGPAQAGDDVCVTDWSEAAIIVKNEGLLTVDKLAEQAKAHNAGDIVKTTLCTENGKFVYRLVVREEKGQLKSLTVDAKTPFAR